MLYAVYFLPCSVLFNPSHPLSDYNILMIFILVASTSHMTQKELIASSQSQYKHYGNGPFFALFGCFSKKTLAKGTPA